MHTCSPHVCIFSIERMFEGIICVRCVGCTAGYITGVLEDARVYSGHAGKKELDVADVRLAVQTRVDHSFTTPPPRDVSSCVHQRKFCGILDYLPVHAWLV